MRIPYSVFNMFSINQAYIEQRQRSAKYFTKTFKIFLDVHNFADMALSPKTHSFKLYFLGNAESNRAFSPTTHRFRFISEYDEKAILYV
jgi:hypothetical protein